MAIPSAFCPVCGILYKGWSLRYKPLQRCERCLSLLEPAGGVDADCAETTSSGSTDEELRESRFGMPEQAQT